jgi:CRP-like cAMP-binding protein
LLCRRSAFDLHAVLQAAGFQLIERAYAASSVIFSQGDPATDVMYVLDGRI